jgi:CRISPR-associated protein Cas4
MISVSMLSSYLYCKRKLYLQSVLRLLEPPKEAMVLGSLRHNVYNLINKKEEEIVTSIKKKESINKIYSIYKQHHSQILRNKIIENKAQLKQFNLNISKVFRQTWPLVLEETYMRANNVYNFMQTHLVFGEELWERLIPKIESEISITSKVYNLKGVIDKLEIYPLGYVPIELKTGKCPKEGVWPSHLIQIGAYALLVEDKFDTEIKEAFILYLDQKIKRHIEMNPFLRLEVKETLSKVNNLLKSDNIPDFCKNSNKCKVCNLKNQCYNKSLIKKKLKSNL